MLGYSATPPRLVGSKVYSTGFHTSDPSHSWIPPGMMGEVIQSRPCIISFPTEFTEDGITVVAAINAATFRSDISNTERGAFAVHATDRKNARWRI